LLPEVRLKGPGNVGSRFFPEKVKS
jgi:hypothetical protein